MIGLWWRVYTIVGGPDPPFWRCIIVSLFLHHGRFMSLTIELRNRSRWWWSRIHCTHSYGVRQASSTCISNSQQIKIRLWLYDCTHDHHRSRHDLGCLALLLVKFHSPFHEANFKSSLVHEDKDVLYRIYNSACAYTVVDPVLDWIF